MMSRALKSWSENVGIEFAAHFEADLGRRRGDQLDDRLMSDERLATSVHGDEREQAMLVLVPLARALLQAITRSAKVRRAIRKRIGHDG